MRRPINHRVKSHAPVVPVPDPDPIMKKLLETEAAILEEDEKLINDENKVLDKEDMMPFIISNEDEIINYIKEKATKETLKSLAPLLEKLEEAVKQQQAYQQAVPAASPANPVAMSYEDQLKKLQEVSKGKIKEKELKIAERMNKLQARFANIRK
ncbi:hypothetical protein [Chryseobacterium daeguense]|uniref:hypothetical protein n=1 Tax=Chryseobacterium daeguense TaxID=412438 RepID=UPI000418BDDF|nr:hypothetical protein [Chryseobacterium daeguense]